MVTRLFTLFSFVFTSGQSKSASSDAGTATSLPVVLDYRTRGYMGNIRLDSINAQYAEFGLKAGDGISFYYGQSFSKSKDLLLKDEKNIPLVFINRNTAFLLNFFYYNGWELANITNPQSDGRFVLKKIQR